MIDTHSHIDMLKNPNLSVEESVKEGVESIVLPASGPSGFGKIIDLCNMHKEVYGALGVHPEEFINCTKDVQKDIFKLASENEKIVAIGEIGLDYYYDKTNSDEQKKVFKSQLEIALELNLPVLVHDREAHLDTYNILSALDVKKVILHCFSGSADFAVQCIEKGWLLGIGGIVTFKNSKKMKEVVKRVPLEKLVLETDAPYLTPHPFRGEENSPKYLKFIAKEIANIKDTTFEHVDLVTTQTAKEFFNLK